MSNSMWPWWKKISAPEEGTYRLMHFAGVQLGAFDEEIPIAVLESLQGGLNFAVPIVELSSIMVRATREEAAEDFKTVSQVTGVPTSVGELANKIWTVHPREVVASGLTRSQWYEREIGDFISRKSLIDPKDDV